MLRVDLLHATPIEVGSIGVRTCWNSHIHSDQGGLKDREILDRVGNQYKHKSVLEHINFSFYISGISRALLQELARHRIASLSVKSSRYTLKELKNEEPFTSYDKDKDIYHVTPNQAKRAGEYLVFTHDTVVDRFSIMALDNLRIALKQGISNDKAKYCLPEAYQTELTWTINLRSLQNFLSLRSDKSALWEIRKLAHEVFNAVPNTHKYLLEDSLKEQI